MLTIVVSTKPAYLILINISHNKNLLIEEITQSPKWVPKWWIDEEMCNSSVSLCFVVASLIWIKLYLCWLYRWTMHSEQTQRMNESHLLQNKSTVAGDLKFTLNLLCEWLVCECTLWMTVYMLGSVYVSVYIVYIVYCIWTHGGASGLFWANQGPTWSVWITLYKQVSRSIAQSIEVFRPSYCV